MNDLGYCFTLTLIPEEPRLLTLAEPVEASTLQMQYLRSALAKWRQRNRFADAIEFKDFPREHKDTIKLAAHMLMNKGEEL